MKIVNLMRFQGAWLLKEIFGNNKVPDLEILDLHLQPEDAIVDGVRDADIILADGSAKTPITSNIALAAEKTKLIQTLSAGYNGIDLEACRKANIKVANAPGSNAFSVAEHTIMMALMLLKRVLFLNQRTHAGMWKDTEIEFSIHGLQRKVYGLLGMGHIGKAMAERLVPFEVKTFYYDLIRLTEEQEKSCAATWAGIDEILTKADIVSLHLPLNKQTEGLIGAREIALMKETALFINVSRGRLVDEEALARALREKKIAGAGIDVFAREPITEDHPLIGLENVILTPHTAGSSQGAHENIKALAAENILNIVAGNEPNHVLNP